MKPARTLRALILLRFRVDFELKKRASVPFRTVISCLESYICLTPRRVVICSQTRLFLAISMENLPSSIRFVCVGLSNTALSLAVIWIALKIVHLSDLQANVIGYVIGILWSFVLNRSWTFRHRGRISTGFVRFALVCGTAYAANVLVLTSLASRVGSGVFWTQIAGMVVYAGVSYLGSRYFAFPRTAAEPA